MFDVNACTSEFVIGVLISYKSVTISSIVPVLTGLLNLFTFPNALFKIVMNCS